ncbi:hypothetical protein [Epilithonimonas mollis]|uniref:Uncharacterized protein n=1 Tax=Epilithonimonas mollis TaxID=216903 RepID=A0A1M6Q453_9FLAO|nr:hypothetical protein [Epilithonimonas mollis]SHK14960.1 hypothetical protein SAMN05444371_1500 [Epilithonimonas mollis]
MKKYLYLLIIPFSLTNCYTYKTNSEIDAKKQDRRETQVKQDNQLEEGAAIDNQTGIQSAPSTKISRNSKVVKNKIPQATNITEQLEPNKFYKIDVADRSYKIQVDKWESDSLVAHVIHKPKKILKFHRNQINQSTIAERRFSQPVADILTVVAYTGIGVGIWALVR